MITVFIIAHVAPPCEVRVGITTLFSAQMCHWEEPPLTGWCQGLWREKEPHPALWSAPFTVVPQSLCRHIDFFSEQSRANQHTLQLPDGKHLHSRNCGRAGRSPSHLALAQTWPSLPSPLLVHVLYTCVPWEEGTRQCVSPLTGSISSPEDNWGVGVLPMPNLSPGGESLQQGTRPSSVLLTKGSHQLSTFILARAPEGHMLLFLLRGLFIFRVAGRMVYGKCGPKWRGWLDSIFSTLWILVRPVVAEWGGRPGKEPGELDLFQLCHFLLVYLVWPTSQVVVHAMYCTRPRLPVV